MSLGATLLTVHLAPTASEFDVMLKINESVGDIYKGILSLSVYIFKKFYHSPFFAIQV